MSLYEVTTVSSSGLEVRCPKCGLRRTGRKAPHSLRLRGFTLIELLVVIAIIAIMAALLLTALNAVKPRVDFTVCKANLKQIEMGLTMYVQDTHVYPGGGESPFHVMMPFVGGSWPDDNIAPVSGYLGPVRSVWACPGYNHIKGIFFENNYGAGVFYNASSAAYGFNMWGQSTRSPSASIPPIFRGLIGTPVANINWDVTPVRESQVLNPAQMIALGDSVMVDDGPPDWVFPAVRGFMAVDFWNDPWLPVNFAYLTQGAAPSTPVQRVFYKRHLSKWNIGYCDGHVEGKRRQDVFNTNRPDQMAQWNIDNQAHSDADWAVLY